MAEKQRATCWRDWKEWSFVYNLIFNSNDAASTIEGLKLIDVWRSRSEAKLPVAVDCTACLVSANLGRADQVSGGGLGEIVKRLAMAMALVRFVNGMADQVQKGVYARSVQTIAEEINLPDWLVDLRHDATHSSLPSMKVLEAGCHVALKWLKSNYWEPTSNSVNRSRAVVVNDEFADLLHQYLHKHWPLKEADKKFLESYNMALARTLSSSDALRYSIIPLLLKDGILLPTQTQIEELTQKGFVEPMKQIIQFWTPLILWIQEKNVEFVVLLTDSLLKYVESRHDLCKTRGFVTLLISTLITHLQSACGSRELMCRIFKHCILDPTRESNLLLSTINTLVNLSESKQVEIRALKDTIAPYGDIFTRFGCSRDSKVIATDYARLQEYFETMPIIDLNLSCLRPDSEQTQTDIMNTWSSAAGIPWTSIQEGVSLNGLKPHSNLDMKASLGKLPETIDAAVDLAISRSNNKTDQTPDVNFSRLSSNKMKEYGAQNRKEESVGDAACRQSVGDEAQSHSGVTLF